MTGFISFILIITVDYLITVILRRVLTNNSGHPEFGCLVLLVPIMVYVYALMIIARQWLPRDPVGMVLCHHLVIIVAQEDVIDSPDLTRIVICGNCLVL
jgi:hypothetical protein